MAKYRVDPLKPSLFDPNYLERFGRVRKLQEFFAKQVAARGTAEKIRVLDLGSRGAPYRALWMGGAVEWIAGDLSEWDGVSLRVDAHALALADESVDVVLCTQMMEYVSDPMLCMAEMYRVLRVGGTAIVSAPAVLPPMGPSKWNFMPNGWKQLTAQFREVVVDAEMNSAASFFRLNNAYLVVLTHQIPLVRPLVGWTLIPLFNVLGRWAMPRFRDIGAASNYVVQARK